MESYFVSKYKLVYSPTTDISVYIVSYILLVVNSQGFIYSSTLAVPSLSVSMGFYSGIEERGTM